MSAQIRRIAVILLLAFILVSVSGCQSKSIDLVNTQTIDLEGVNGIEITYASENITVYENNNNTLVIKEYMSADRPEYYANISSANNSIKINSGQRPVSMQSYIEVYLPESYGGDFSLTTSSGKIKITGAYHFDNFFVKTASGAIEIAEITASSNRIDSSSGAINISQITGNMKTDNSSGKIEIGNAAGSGTYSTSNGVIKISFSDVNGDITCKTSGGKINLSVPDSLSFNYKIRTGTGAIKIPFSASAATRNSASGSVGTDPVIQIDLSTSSGAVEVDYR